MSAEWRDRAACIGTPPNMFHPKDYGGVLAAIAYCDTCPVSVPCLDWALHHEPYGVWGGTSERQRVRMRRAAGIVCAEPTYRDPAERPEPVPDDELDDEEEESA